MIQSSSVLVLSGDVRYRVINDEAVLVRQRAGEVLALNEVGTRVVELLDGRRQVGEIVDALVDELEVERSTLEKDALEFLQELADSGVVGSADDGQ